MVSSQDEENKLAQTTRGSWPDGGDVQETNGQSRMQSDWATLAINGTVKASKSALLVSWCNQGLA